MLKQNKKKQKQKSKGGPKASKKEIQQNINDEQKEDSNQYKINKRPKDDKSDTDNDTTQKNRFSQLYPLSLSADDMNGPKAFANACHWLIKNLVLIGEYPLTSQYVDHLIQKEGISAFICMVDLKEEVDQYQLSNYWKQWVLKNKEYKNLKIDLLESPIRDFSVSDDKTMIGFLERIVKHIMNGGGQIKNKYYMHCMTGHGRTGLISVLLMMALYKTDWQTTLDLMKMYHYNRDCKNGTFFYNSCGSCMAIKDKKYDSKKYSLQDFYPMPQENSQFAQIKRLQDTMHAIHDKYVDIQ